MAALSIELPKRENPYGGEVYNELINSFPLNVIETKGDHRLSKDLLLKLMRYKNTLNDENKSAQINAYLGSLSLLIMDYEKKFKFNKPSPIDILKNLMEMHELTQNDLRNEIGAQPHVSRILSGERDLTADQMKSLGRRFKIAPSVFL